jgi:CO/xanthine dehydrogenase FAD-binding subunit
LANVCHASPAADGIPFLLALEATVVLASTTGTRTLPLHDFLLGPPNRPPP